MCGRFTQYYTWTEVHAFLSLLGTARNLRPHYNIAPTTNVDVVRLDREGRRELVSMRWGLVPFFWKKALKDVPAITTACRCCSRRRISTLGSTERSAPMRSGRRPRARCANGPYRSA